MLSINRIAEEMGWRIERIAVDAPAAPPATGSRASEIELGRCGLSSFRTPPTSAWADIIKKCVDHLRGGGTAATLPYANKIWTLAALSSSNSRRSDLTPKSSRSIRSPLSEHCCQYASTSRRTRDTGISLLQLRPVRDGCLPQKLEARLTETVPGSRHDRLDAFMAAWVASLPRAQRRAFGDAERSDDAIWVPL